MMTKIQEKDSLGSCFERAKEAQKIWEAVPLKERLQKIAKLSDVFLENKEQLARILTQDMGKPITESRNEIDAACKRIVFFLNHTEAVLKEKKVQEGEVLTHVPLGVIANISAWNYPYLVGVNVIVPALLAGNAVLYKPSEYAAQTGIAIEQKLKRIALPEGLFQTISGDGSVGEALLELPIDGVFFTGSLKTGKKIKKRVGDRLIPVGLELGGKDPGYVTDSLCDLKETVHRCIEGAFYNNGQSCCALERLYVHANIYDDFIHFFVEKVKKRIVGNPFEEKTQQGPLARLEQVTFLQTLVDDAVKKGAVLLLGGKVHPLGDAYYLPTVLTNVNHTMQVMRDESFGPIIGIQKVFSDEEAIQLMNDTHYGLTAAVFSQDLERAEKILCSLSVGTGYVNCCDKVSPNLPWSGHRESGLGATLGEAGILAFSLSKNFIYS